MKKIAIIGTQGIPAQYGGFETLVENMTGPHASPDIRYTVFCSGRDFSSRPSEWKGVKLEYIPLHANGMQSIPYDIWSLAKTIGKGYDAVLILGVSGCIALPVFKLLYRRKIIVNIDGLEHRRDKWGPVARWFLRLSERLAVRFSDVVIGDNRGISDYVARTYGKTARTIAYGGDHAIRSVPENRRKEILDSMGLESGGYALSVCRIEPENNCHVTLEAFSETGKRLVFIGNWERSDYGVQLKKRFGSCSHIRMADPVYDLDVLYTLRKHCSVYVHGHSAGGTNPSLVEAMHCGVPVLACDVVYNRETTGGRAHYFKDSGELLNLLQTEDAASWEENARAMKQMAQEEYVWEKIVREYENCY